MDPDPVEAEKAKKKSDAAARRVAMWRERNPVKYREAQKLIMRRRRQEKKKGIRIAQQNAMKNRGGK